MLAILDYDAGNLRSVTNALDRIGQQYFVSDNPQRLDEADKLIFPGVGHAGAAMASLKTKQLDGFLRDWKKPLLGICVGMQLLFDHSEEGDTDGLGIIPGKVVRFKNEKVGVVPHMGWNAVYYKNKVDNGLCQVSDFYFVHSYYCVAEINEHMFGETDYNEQKFCSIVMKDNIMGTQFHVEKSGPAGAKLLAAFCAGELPKMS